jgi:hypothetical protein
MKTTKAEFVICVKNSDYPASLELRKLYQVLPDREAAERRLLRVIDESGEDYLYPENYFIAVRLREPARRAVRRAVIADSGAVSRSARMG